MAEQIEKVDFLTACVREATGIPTAEAREGQYLLAENIRLAMGEGDGHVIGAAPTGTGKSISYLAPAVEDAILNKRRTLIAPSDLGLMEQIAHKDAPDVIRAGKAYFGETAKVAMVKGWSNYACGLQASMTAKDMLGVPRSTKMGLQMAIDRLTSERFILIQQGTVRIGTRDFDAGPLADLVLWAMAQSLDNKASGDKATYPGHITGEMWQLVSVSTAECLSKKCPLANFCKPRLSRELASEADIIVTNHSLLAVQAARRVSVVIGSTALGRIDNVVIDECHTLPGIIRQQGASEVSRRRLDALARRFSDMIATDINGSMSKRDDGVVSQLKAVGDSFGKDLSDLTNGLRRGGTMALDETHDAALAQWGSVFAVETAASIMVERLKDCSPRRNPNADEIRLKNLAADIRAFKTDVEQVLVSRVGVARWAEVKESRHSNGHSSNYPILASTPVSVGFMAKNNLWSRPSDGDDALEAKKRKEAAEAEAEDFENNEDDPYFDSNEPITGEDGDEERIPLAVIAVSATVPKNFAAESGMKAQRVAYPAPFAKGLKESALFVPELFADDVKAVTNSYGKFDTELFAAWAAEIIADLVEANDGHSLVLAVKAAHGKVYAARLREIVGSHINVYSQWDTRSPAKSVALWRDDPHSVLVGTKTMMTGLDAKGETNSLTILDRVPRAPGNPTDDARSTSIQEALEMDKWAADRMIYSQDASLLMEQAMGRLIRTEKDRGMFACLDPRLLKGSPVAYPEQTRSVYMTPLREMGVKFADLEKAVGWLHQRVARRKQTAKK